MKVYLAQEIFLYEGANNIGIYSTETKARDACVAHWGENHDRHLEWVDDIAIGNNKHHYFEISEIEIDT